MAGNSLESNFVSMKHAVEFLNFQDQYYCNEDLHCTFKFNDYDPQEGDRVAIFKVGWTFVKDYIVFEWAPIGSEESCSVIFNKHILPKKNFEEIYQVCYLSGENELHGASSPFQFSADRLKPVEVISTSTMEESLYQSLSKIKVPAVNQPDNEEFKKLQEENDMLKQALKVALAHKEAPIAKNYDTDIAELQQITGALKIGLDSQQQEINTLKTKILESREEYKKLYLEKYKLEKKYEHLKSKKDKEQKPVNLIEFDISDMESIPPFPFTNNLDK